MITVSRADTGNAKSIEELAFERYGTPGLMKSGTPAIMRLLKDDSDEMVAAKAAFTENTRPVMDRFADSSRGLFRVHYNLTGKDAPDLTDADGNSIPDYVDSTLVYLEYAWDLLVNDLGYGQPRYDGLLGGAPRDLIDCYLLELSDSSSPVYGLTKPDSFTGGSSSSFLEIDNGFTENVYNTKGYDALKITTAHEFFHVIHYSYYGAYDSLWFMEQSAVWFEDYAWDDINDYLNYIGFLFTDRDTPLDSSDGTFMYGATLFAFYLDERYGDSTIRQLWSTFKLRMNGGIENLNTVLSDGLPSALSECAVWLYFTGYRANSDDFYRDADIIRQYMRADKTVATLPNTDSLSFRHYTFKYIDITPQDGLAYGDSLNVSLTDKDGGIWRNKIIFYNDPHNYEVVSLSATKSSVAVSRPFERAVLVLANASPSNKYYRYVYSIDYVNAKNVKKEPIPTPFALEQNYPNPFNGTTMIPYSLDHTAHVKLRIVNLQGATVAVLADDVFGPGKHTVPFDGVGLSSGTYFAILESGGMRFSKKIMFLK